KEHNTLIKEINKGRSNEEIEVGDNSLTLVSDITELEILQEVFNHPIDLPKEVAKRLFENLFKINNSWSSTKVRDYWYNN
ncbi:4578_t:CDS:2, partial [Entrophospora sp. SA101]